MQDLYFFFERSECKTRTPYKIGNSYLNHFAINEDAAFEIKSVNFLQESSAKMAEVWNEEEYEKHKLERSEKQNYDAEMLKSCLQRRSKFKGTIKEERQIHVIYVGHYYNFREGLDNV